MHKATILKSKLLCSSAVAAALMLGAADTALAEYIEVYPISTDPDDWTADRKGSETLTLLDSYMGRNNVLKLETKAVGADDDSFYQWEGYSQTTTVPAGNSMIGGDILISSDWAAGTDSDFIRTGMWGSVMTADQVETGTYNDNDAIFPIIQFTNKGGAGHLEVWDPEHFTETGWADLNGTNGLMDTSGLINYDSWNTLDMRLITNEENEVTSLVYYFNGEEIYTWEAPESNNGTTPEQFYAMYLKNRNHGGTDFDTYWSRLLSGLVISDNVVLEDYEGDVVLTPGSTVTFAPDAKIGGSVVVRGKTGQPVTLQIDNAVTIEEDVVVSKGSISFSTAEDGVTTVTQSLYVEESSSTRGGTRTNKVQVNGSGYVDTTSTLGGNIAFLKNLQVQGYVDPGNSIGTVSVAGDLDFYSTSVYDVEVDLSGDADLIEVGGVANLAGEVVVDVIDGYLLNYDYVILTADGGISGTFASDAPVWNNINDYAFVQPLLSYDPNTVYLTVERNDMPFASVATTPNQVAVANALETLGDLSTPPMLYDDIVLRLTVDQAPAVYSSLSGEIYADASTVLINQSQYIRDAVTGRLQQAFGGTSTTPVTVMSYAGEDDPDSMAPYEDMGSESAFGVWGSAYGGWTDWEGDSNTGSLKTSSGGFIAGFDAALGDAWRLGVLGGYGYTSFDNKGRASGDNEAYTIGAYAGGAWPVDGGNAWAFRSGLSYTWNTPSVDRTVSFTGFYDKLKGEYDASTFQVFGEVAYQREVGDTLDIEPYVNLSYVNLNSDSFTESGATAAALAVRSETMNTYFTTVGLRAFGDLEIGNSASQVFVDFGWRHAFGDTSPYTTAAFVGSSPFTVAGVPLDEDTAVLGAGFDFAISEQATIGLSYNGQFGGSMSQNSINARLDVRF